jgi:hypothetical protein
LCDGPVIARQFGAVAMAELNPTRRIVAEPFSQFSARRDLLEPKRHRDLFLA